MGQYKFRWYGSLSSPAGETLWPNRSANAPRLRRDKPARKVVVTGTFDNWSKSEELDRVGDGFEKTVGVGDASEKIYYKVGGMFCSGASCTSAPRFFACRLRLLTGLDAQEPLCCRLRWNEGLAHGKCSHRKSQADSFPSSGIIPHSAIYARPARQMWPSNCVLSSRQQDEQAPRLL